MICKRFVETDVKLMILQSPEELACFYRTGNKTIPIKIEDFKREASKCIGAHKGESKIPAFYINYITLTWGGFILPVV